MPSVGLTTLLFEDGNRSNLRNTALVGVTDDGQGTETK